MPDDTHAFTGRCLCGTVRFRADSTPIWTLHCHCESCRRASGAPMVTWVGFDETAVHWETVPPKVFASSPGVERTFCPTCGSPLTFKSKRWPGELHILAAGLDEPERITPTAHVHCDEMLSWIEPGDGLSRHALASDAQTTA